MGVVVLVYLATNGLAVGNLRLTHVGLNIELATHTVNEDVKVKLTHTGDHSLTSFLVLLYAEGGVFFSKLLDSSTQLLLVSLGLGLNSNRDNWLGEAH